MRMKRVARLLAAGMALVMAVGMTACGNGGSGDSSSSNGDSSDGGSEAAEELPEGDVEITFAWWGSDDRHEAMQEVVSLYEAANPNVTVKVEYGAWDGWTQKNLTQLSGKTEADVMQVNYNWVHSFGKGANVYYDLNELSNFIDLDNWDADYLASMTTNDDQLGAVPHGMTGRVQVVNKLIFEEAGIDFPRTYDEVIEAAAVVGKDNVDSGVDNKYVLVNNGEVSTDLFIAQLLYNMTGNVMQTDGTINYSVDEVKAALELYEAFEQSGAMPQKHQEDPIDNESNPVWTNGRAGAVYEWAGTLDKYTGSYQGGGHEEDLEIADYITENEDDKPVIYVKPNLGYAVSKNSANPEVAADFINFMFTNEDAVKALETSLGISSNKVTFDIQEAEGMITGAVKEAYEKLDEYEQVVLDPYFEDENVRGQRYTVIEAFRTGKYGSDEAAERYISMQQEELDKLFK